MSSFYGGKRGASLEIKQSYADYNAMIQDQDNIDYNEYVITTNNNILYRRIQNGYQEITKLTDENKKLVEKVQLAQAELINYRRRKDEEVSSMLKYANVDLVTEILNVVDDFERAVNHAEKSTNDEVKKYNEGINLIYTNLKSILQKFGVEEINNVGSIFNPNEEYVYTKEMIVSKSKNSPFIGKKLKGKVKYTIVGGKIVYEN